MKLSEVKRAAGALNLKQLVKLDAWLHGLLEATQHAGGIKATKRRLNHKTYQQELVRCGKKNCKCAKGQLHGPYWYAYWTEGGKSRSQYIGKRLPKGIKPARITSPRRVR